MKILEERLSYSDLLRLFILRVFSIIGIFISPVIFIAFKFDCWLFKRKSLSYVGLLKIIMDMEKVIE